MMIVKILFFISLQLLFLSPALTEPNIKPDCKLSCEQIVKRITSEQYAEAHKKIIAIILRDYERMGGEGGAEAGSSSYVFFNSKLEQYETKQSCRLRTLAHCIMVEQFETVYQQQADTLSKELVDTWDDTDHGGLGELLRHLDSAIESINILKSNKSYVAPKNIVDLFDNNQITHFIVRRMLKKYDSVLVNKYLSSIKDLKGRVEKDFKLKHSIKNK